LENFPRVHESAFLGFNGLSLIVLVHHSPLVKDSKAE
jgi:hypothetical protein